MKNNIIVTLQIFATIIFSVRLGLFIEAGASIQEAGITIIILLVFISSTIKSFKTYMEE